LFNCTVFLQFKLIVYGTFLLCIDKADSTGIKTKKQNSKRESSTRIDYVPALCTHRPSLLPIEWLSELCGLSRIIGNFGARREADQTCPFRGSKSRNKVSVGEPAEGSLTRIHVPPPVHITADGWGGLTSTPPDLLLVC